MVLVLALLVLVGGAHRAFAHTASTTRHGATAAAARRAPSAPERATPAQAPAPARAARPTGPVVAGQEATVEIPSLGVSLPVVRGGQDVIDRGFAAHYVGAQWRPPTEPGRPGTYWLAAHSSTHGSPFANLPAIAEGAKIRVISPDGTVFTYLVTSHEVVGTTTTLATVYGRDPTTPRILLQTCEGAAKRLLVHGTLTSVTSG